MKLSFHKGAITLFALVLALMTMSSARAQSSSRKDRRMRDAERRANAASKVFEQIMDVRDNRIPKELIDKAEAIAVFPGVIKAAFIIGGRGGQGLISRRVAGGWSAPAFYNIGGGSVGLQVGAQKTDYVMLIMNADGLKGLMEDKFELGGEMSVAAGPVGREAAASTNLTLDAGILSYSRSKGLFAGVALKGAVINPDNDLNEAVYEGRKASEVIGSRMRLEEMPDAVRAFPVMLNRYSRR